jgi:hypothetical protein
VISIGNNAFQKSALQRIVIPTGVTSIGANAFAGTTALTSVIFGGDSILVSIGENAFVGSGLQSIEVPESVNNIGRNAFANTNALFAIYYNGILTDQYLRNVCGVGPNTQIIRRYTPDSSSDALSRPKRSAPGGSASSVTEARRLNTIAQTWDQPSKQPKVPSGNVMPSVFARNAGALAFRRFNLL